MSLAQFDSVESSRIALPIDRIMVLDRRGEYVVVAMDDFAPGETVMTVAGELSTQPCRYSVQVGRHVHVSPPPSAGREAGHDRWLWRFLNHSCKPNSAMRRTALVAIQPIARGQEITFDYNANEYDMASPFQCRCGHCGGVEIRGFRHLSPEEQRRRSHWLAPHLRDLLDEVQ